MMKLQLIVLAVLTAIGSCSEMQMHNRAMSYNDALPANGIFAGRMVKRANECDPRGDGGCSQAACSSGTATCANGSCACIDLPKCPDCSSLQSQCAPGADAVCGSAGNCYCKITNGGANCASNMNYIDSKGTSCCALSQAALQAKADC
ncbi:uncharacterized protein RCC_07773 [Ramularia collo-cygni]|uniref:Uncharacterized protein n=1 Tax=Ramularia collo-cygni TaxID=112498 RepID=A0A2D3VDM4_9PEZI|nr:uncharacterized protein RCC_07773 [Ramularia collo-cygni]CZT21906.1 uncharacterized protein RCC_07773 [Ramularia collo-cygni]